MRKRIFPFPILFLFALAISFFFQNCVKDHCTNQYTLWEPVYQTKAEVRANIKSNAPREIERPGKIYIRGNYIFLNEIDRGIHIIDNSNPAFPRKLAFIDIPGNLDMAVKGNMLYADFYTELVTIDITDPLHVAVRKFTEDIFPERFWGNGFSPNPTMVVVDWAKKDTIVEIDCGRSDRFFGGLGRADVFFAPQALSAGAAAAPSPFGAGGSMARFTVVNNHLYAVSQSSLNVVSISNPEDPVFNNRVNIGWGIETIYPFSNRLFIGSNSGMFIYDITNPASPVQMGTFSHARSCDPVIADNDHAYVTLRSGTPCEGFSNQLDVLDIGDLNHPLLVKTYSMTNPHGLAKDGSTLLVCDGRDGLRIYNAADAGNLVLQKTIPGLETYDVIAINGWALVVARDGLYQFDYRSLSDTRLISKITVKN